jgi:hypothetical protein
MEVRGLPSEIISTLTLALSRQRERELLIFSPLQGYGLTHLPEANHNHS